MLPLQIVASGRIHSNRQEQVHESPKGIKQEFAVSILDKQTGIFH